MKPATFEHCDSAICSKGAATGGCPRTRDWAGPRLEASVGTVVEAALDACRAGACTAFIDTRTVNGVQPRNVAANITHLFTARYAMSLGAIAGLTVVRR